MKQLFGLKAHVSETKTSPVLRGTNTFIWLSLPGFLAISLCEQSKWQHGERQMVQILMKAALNSCDPWNHLDTHVLSILGLSFLYLLANMWHTLVFL